MKAEKLSTEIAALERQSSKAKNAVLKKVLAKKIDKLKTELESITSEETAKESIKKAKTKVNAMDAKQFEAYIKNLAKDPKFSFLKNMTSGEIVRDMKRTAKPVGWRFRGRNNAKTPTKKDIKDKNNVYYEGRRNRSDVSRKIRLVDGGGVDGWENLSNVKPNNIEISETSAFGNPDKLILKYNGKQIAKFYYNMRGYNSDFSLKNSEGLYYGFGGDKPKSKQVSEFKKALKEGFTFIKGSKYKNGGGIDEEGIDLFEDYENIPENVQNILDKYEDGFMDGDYQKLEKAHKELEKIGYTFEYYLDGQAYDLRPIGTKGKSETEEFKNGGGVDINDWDMPVIRTQFEDEEFEYAKGGETGEPHRTKVNGMMAKGGAIQHGLKVGDKIVADQFWENTIVVENAKTNKRAVVYLETGKRKEA